MVGVAKSGVMTAGGLFLNVYAMNLHTLQVRK